MVSKEEEGDAEVNPSQQAWNGNALGGEKLGCLRGARRSGGGGGLLVLVFFLLLLSEPFVPKEEGGGR